MGAIHISMAFNTQASQVLGIIICFIAIYMVYLNELPVEWVVNSYATFFTCIIMGFTKLTANFFPILGISKYVNLFFLF